MSKYIFSKKLLTFGLAFCTAFTPCTSYAKGFEKDISTINDNITYNSVNPIGIEPTYNKLPETNSKNLQLMATSVNDRDTFIQELRKNLMKRSSIFTITYNGNLNDIIGSNWEKLFEDTWSIDDPNTSDDFDYLKGSIVSYSYNVSYTNSKAIFTFNITYVENANKVKEVNKAVKSALSSLNISNLSDFEKVKAIHDYVVNLFSYDQTMIDHSVYGGLVANKHTTVCQGYALTIYKMLTEAGVPCRYVTGYSGEAHAWNLVKLGSKWYHLDATWDDPISSKPVLSHEYFLVGSKKISKDHVLDKEYTTSSFKKLYPISSKDYNYNDKDIENNSNDNLISENIKKRQKFALNLCNTLDDDLNYDDVSEYKQITYDLYKKIMTSVICQISDEKFEQIKSNANALAYLVDTSQIYIENQIIIPAFNYLESDNLLYDALDLLDTNYSSSELNNMSDTEFTRIAETYINQLFNKKLNSLSKKYTNKIIKRIINDVNNNDFF